MHPNHDRKQMSICWWKWSIDIEKETVFRFVRDRRVKWTLQATLTKVCRVPHSWIRLSVGPYFQPCHEGCGCGARHLRSPSGGAAYGMPLKARLLSKRTPRTSPLDKWTTSASWDTHKVNETRSIQRSIPKPPKEK